MFDHLDDEQPFAPDEPFRAGVLTGGRRLRRLRRVTTAITSAVIAVALLSAAVAGYGAWRVGHVSRLTVGPGTLTRPPPEAAFDILIAGVDRPAPPVVRGTRSDVILVARIDPRRGRLTVITIPRDLEVAIPGVARPDRINTAFDLGGPDLLVRTVEQDLGLPVSHVVVVDMAGLPALVDALGGVHVQIAAPIRDAYSGLNLPTAGCRQLDGSEALALVRSRHLELLGTDGTWRFDPQSDLGRQLRVQVVLRAMGTKARLLGADPVSAAELLRAFVDHVAVDRSLSTGEILHIAKLLLQIRSDDVRMALLPTRPVQVAGSDVLVATPATPGFLRSFLAGDALPIPTPPVGIGTAPAPACRP